MTHGIAGFVFELGSPSTNGFKIIDDKIVLFDWKLIHVSQKSGHTHLFESIGIAHAAVVAKHKTKSFQAIFDLMTQINLDLRATHQDINLTILLDIRQQCFGSRRVSIASTLDCIENFQVSG